MLSPTIPLWGPAIFGRRFDPLSLFAAGEQGVWYDPSDLSTLFQDTAGTTPVTAAGQPVGLMRDKSGRGNHATQATATSRPILQTANGLWYLAFDGVDDGMQTAAINFTSTNKLTLWAGVTKLNDATFAPICEFSVQASANSGAFSLLAPSGSNDGSYGMRSGGTVNIAVSMTPFVAPHTAVLSGAGDISAPILSMSVNGAKGTPSVASQGTGNYGTYPLFIGRRGTATSPLNGRIYGLIVRGAKSTDAEIANTEAWMNSKTGAY